MMTDKKIQELQVQETGRESIKQKQRGKYFSLGRSLGLWPCLMVLILLLSIVITAAFIRPLLLERRQDLRQAERMRRQAETVQHFADQFGRDEVKYEAELARLEEKTAFLARLLPSAQELDSNAVIAACCRAAAERQVQVNFIKAESQQAKLTGKDNIGAYKIRMNLSGEFFRLQDYLRSLETLQAAGCLCRWQQLKITSDASGVVEAEGVLLAFVREK